MSPSENQRSKGLHPIGLSTLAVHIDQDAPPRALMDDLRCLFDSAMSSLDGMSDFSVDEVATEWREHWWAMLYTMRAAQGVLHRMDELLPPIDVREGGAA